MKELRTFLSLFYPLFHAACLFGHFTKGEEKKGLQLGSLFLLLS